MTNMLTQLVGRRVNQAALIHDYLQLRFEHGEILNVYSVFEVNGNPRADVDELSSCTVQNVKANKDAITLMFDGGWSLRIGLLNSDYRGPEALEYIDGDGERSVWT